MVSVRRVTDIISEITAASQEQIAGIDQINQAISAMDDTTQQNAALVEEAAAAAASLQNQAEKLVQVVSVFHIDGKIASTGASHTQPARPTRVAIAGTARATAPTGNAKRAEVMVKPAKPAASAPAADDWEEF